MTQVADTAPRATTRADAAVLPPGAPPAPAPRGTRRIAAVVGLVALAAAGTAWFFASPAAGPIRVAGVVEANEVVVSATFTARMLELRVDEGDRVEAGAVIAVLDRAELIAERDRHVAAVQQLAAKLAQSQEVVALESERASGHQAIAQAALAAATQLRDETTAELDQRRADAARMRTLFDQGLVARQELERRTTDLRIAEAQIQSRESAVSSAEAELTLARSGNRQVTVASSDVERTRAEMRQAQAQLTAIRARLSQTIITAPLTGVVALRVARQGEVVEAGRPIVTIVDDSERWVRAAVDETLAGQVRLGQAVDLELASGARLTGEITQVAAEAEFATRRDVNRVRRDVRSLRFKVALPREATGVYPGLTAYVELPGVGGQ